MKIIKYLLCTKRECGGELLTPVTMSWNETNEETAKKEAYNGEYTIEDDGQPTGAHDAYNTGDIVNYNGTLYQSVIDGNVYSPEAYPAGWVVYTE